MKGYLKEANLRMILVSPSVPQYRAKYLEELGIRCVELREIPENSATEKEIAKASRASMHREKEVVEREALLQPGDRLVWEEATSPSTPHTVALARRFLRDSLEPVRRHFSEYEVVPYGVIRPNAPDMDFEYDEASAYGRKEVSHGGVWWAYRLGQSQDAPPNDVPNISVVTHTSGLDVTLNAELQPSQLILQRRIRSDPDQFNRLLSEHGGLWLKTYFKLEHQPRFYHWILADRLAPGDFDAARIIEAYRTYTARFDEYRTRWLDRIVQFNKQLSPKQFAHLNRTNKSLNLATRLVYPFLSTDPFWGESYEEQVKQATEAVVRLKPFIDFFVGPSQG